MTGGPAVSLLGPLAAELYAAQAGLQFLSAFCIHAFSAMSVLLGLAELLPDTGKGVFSDGARILMLVRNNAAGLPWLFNLRLHPAPTPLPHRPLPVTPASSSPPPFHIISHYF